MSESLKVAGLGMVSSLGTGAAFNAAAMRCHYDGFVQTDSHTVGNENLLVSKAELSDDYRGNRRLAEMMLAAIEEAIQNLPEDARVPLYICLAEENPLLGNSQALPDLIRQQLKEQSYADQINYERSSVFSNGRVSFIQACQIAQRQSEHDTILIIAADSLLQPQRIHYYQSQRRLLQPDNPDAFIPGEAAVALLLTTRELENTTEILGLSIAEESGTIISDEPVTGVGLTQAVNNAAEQSGIAISETAFRISTASGEAYFFKELTHVHGRTMDNPRQDHPLWHPADSIGEVGAAATPAMIVMAHYAFHNGYAPGDAVLCLASNDDPLRAAFILRNLEPQHG